MANSRRGRPDRPVDAVSPVLRPLVWSALVGAIVAGAMATPVYADPPLPNTVPDAGVRPLPAGAPSVPTSTGTPTTPYPLPPSVNGPLASQIMALEVEVAQLGDQLLQLRQERDKATTELTTADGVRQTARLELANARTAADNAAAGALKDAAGLPPGAFGSDLHGLDLLGRIQRGEERAGDTELAAGEVARTQQAEQQAETAYQTASSTYQQKVAAFTTAETRYKARSAALVKLKRDNTDQLKAIERAREAAEQQIGATIGSDSVAGMVAHPKALAAMRYALAQRGDPYLWGAEGPNRFDCSGLMLASYLSVGKRIPRVSREQYNGTRNQSVAREALLPGDLVFFASGSSWTSIHHVGMYIGGGKMVHAPTTGDVVKVSTVWWSRFYAATRIFPAVPAPNATTPPPTTRPPTTPPPTTPPPTTPPPTTKPPTTTPTTPPATKPPTTTPTTPPATPPVTPAPTPNPPDTSTPQAPPVSTSGGQPTGGTSSASRSTPAAEGSSDSD
ncbi:C40 family peptidase [Plantactinospora sp. KLBMP9567]|uniref:C40 family peptidase n=1 Tax=Plantactinospora sp. KLBMP9567 TaxID=3085900 RepID=UPI0029818FC0|nr:NlpC/P60 family protein [Plantactinospora sp. KLBMP9567]MDW5329109.1 NlpC/P60 family protein [Plantactinospora sp. KLBMP9567]MDW5329987.1 NlpC/P60 family protein [Plantactinospora sp. KLBMP9567]